MAGNAGSVGVRHSAAVLNPGGRAESDGKSLYVGKTRPDRKASQQEEQQQCDRQKAEQENGSVEQHAEAVDTVRNGRKA